MCLGLTLFQVTQYEHIFGRLSTAFEKQATIRPTDFALTHKQLAGKDQSTLAVFSGRGCTQTHSVMSRHRMRINSLFKTDTHVSHVHCIDCPAQSQQRHSCVRVYYVYFTLSWRRATCKMMTCLAHLQNLKKIKKKNVFLRLRLFPWETCHNQLSHLHFLLPYSVQLQHAEDCVSYFAGLLCFHDL